MDIKLISFADKVTGASDATGKIAADDVNQIKKILNAVVSALFPLDSTNTATSAVLKAGALPAVDIFTNNFSTDFVVSGGVIALSGLPQLPIAPPLTNGVVDDDANTFTGTLPDGYAVTDLEATFNGGTSWATITALPLEVGDVALATNQVGLRIKATSERQHSAALYNSTAFTSSAGNNDPDAGFSAFNLLPVNGNTFSGFTVSGSDNNEIDGVWNGSGANYDFAAPSGMKVAAGTVAVIRANPDLTKYQIDTGGSIFMGLKDNAGFTGYKDMLPSIILTHRSATSCIFQVIYNANDGNGPQYYQTNTINFTLPPRIQVRTTGTRIYAEYSVDGGNTWIDVIPAVNVPQPNADLYFKGYTEYYKSGDASSLMNIIQTGMVATS